ncbi:hypothetical protein [Massilia sp. Dwa41.01b]|uniref:hypothetical protein n=1 Tax=Massilia sp. Dwa41.01b TaxID=2709302 RepID=UPI001E51584C|nr:hypothetical protein [Massilia sp. Dwa41.01b]
MGEIIWTGDAHGAVDAGGQGRDRYLQAAGRGAAAGTVARCGAEGAGIAAATAAGRQQEGGQQAEQEYPYAIDQHGSLHGERQSTRPFCHCRAVPRAR